MNFKELFVLNEQYPKHEIYSKSVKNYGLYSYY